MENTKMKKIAASHLFRPEVQCDRVIRRWCMGGFTLIELLVVIAIIALLLSISLPGLRRAKEAGRRIVCMSNMRGLAQAELAYAAENENRVTDGIPEGPYGWVNFKDLNYYNPDNDPVLLEQQREAVRRGRLWPYTDVLDVYTCPTMRKGQAVAFAKPSSFAHSDPYPVAAAGANAQLLIRKTTDVRNSGSRMLFIDEGVMTMVTWTIYYNEQRWWDAVPMRHAQGTNLAFLDGHAEYWKWEDERTRKFAIQAEQEFDVVAPTYWRRHEPGNDDITRLVMTTWGKVGWTSQ